MVSKLKRPHTKWEKIFASYTSDKRHRRNIQGAQKTKLPPKINESIKNGQMN
jgi:hypothetical protein